MVSNEGGFVLRHCAYVGVLLMSCIPAAGARAQDSPAMARAIERTRNFDVGLDPKPQPVAKWVGADRLAYSQFAKAPWTVLDATTARVVDPSADDGAVGGAGSPMSRPFGLAYLDSENWGVSPGRWTAQMDGNDIVVSESDGTKPFRLTGSEKYAWRSMPSRAWSNNQRFLLAFRIDSRAVHQVPIVDYSTPLERVTYSAYPKVGTPVPVTELYMVDPADAVARRAKLDTRDATIWFLGWRPKVAEALVMRLSRNGKRLDLFAIDGATGDARLLAVDERPQTFVGALDFTTDDWPWQVIPLPDESGFLWMSERDGWRHVYRYSYDGVLKNRVTSGTFPVQRVVHVDARRRLVYVLASGDSTRPYDRQVYRVGLDGTGFTALTSTPGMHDAQFSSSSDYFIDSYSSLTEPQTVELRRTDGTLVKRLGQASKEQLPQNGYRPPEPFRVKAADGITDLYGVLYRPVDFDSTKQYPIVDYIYGGTFLAVHQTTYLPSGNAAAMQRISTCLAQMGFVVAMLDARGTPGRGKAFQDANYGRIGQIEIADHVAALRALARSRPYMDTTRAGITGHSWGGYFAINGMLMAPDFFKVGYAGGPGDLTGAVSINEPNMGDMSSNQAGYDAGSNFLHASALRGKLKIMHGTSDVMAPLSNTMRMIKALIEAGKTFDLLIMPGQPHAPPGAAGRYYREDVRRYLALNLLRDPDLGTVQQP